MLTVVVLCSFGLSRPNSESYAACDLSQIESITPERPDVPGVLKPEDPAGITMEFGRSRAVLPEIFYLTMEQGGTIPERTKFDKQLKLKKRPLRRQEIDGVILPSEYEAAAFITGPREATVRLCLPATKAATVHPGTYLGGVVIADPRVERTTVSVSVSLQYRRYPPIAVLFGLGILIAGTVSVWAAGGRAQKRDPMIGRSALKDLAHWAGRNVIPIVAGGAAALSAFLVSYWRNPSWGAKAPEDWLTLFGAMFSAFTATVVTTSRSGGTSEVDGEGEVTDGEVPDSRYGTAVVPDPPADPVDRLIPDEAGA
jgi:hypothetical protein